jgi:serine phosphatase RsbU (regulator of sigma subunit)
MEVGEYRHIADTLQNAMLAPASDIPTVAARYIPAVGRLAVGGDWYDVIQLSPTTRGLVVGDCVGHGLEAAAAMSQLRSASRTLLYDGRTPAEVLDGLNRYAGSVAGARFATVVCAIVDRAAGTVTYARAGHLPPLVLGARGGSRWLDGAGSLPLAVDQDRRYVEETVPLGVGEIMLMFSDGLVERRGESIDDGLERLRKLAESARGRPIHQLADTVVQALLPNGPTDDTVLVAKLVT